MAKGIVLAFLAFAVFAWGDAVVKEIGLWPRSVRGDVLRLSHSLPALAGLHEAGRPADRYRALEPALAHGAEGVPDRGDDAAQRHRVPQPALRRSLRAALPHAEPRDDPLDLHPEGACSLAPRPRRLRGVHRRADHRPAGLQGIPARTYRCAGGSPVRGGRRHHRPDDRPVRRSASP